MKTLEQVEADVRMLPAEKQEELRDWLENLLEDQLELTDEFKAKIERGEQDLSEPQTKLDNFGLAQSRRGHGEN